ncbi:MAG TPA: hypothetical protein VMV41_11295 [Cellulomonadaceae bacterium]|nr:hypothetical protein [Cellulomonadaceae bacterium]
MRAQSDELLLTGHAVPDEPGLVDLVATLRRSVDAPAPRPTPALSMLLTDGLAAPGPAPARASTRSAVSAPARGRLRLVWRYVAGLGLAGKIALGAGIAFAGVTGAATIGAVPDAIQVPARAVVHGVEHLFAPGSGAPVPTSRSTDGRATQTPRSSSSAEVPALSGRGPTVRPTPQGSARGVGVKGRSSQAGQPAEGTPTLPAPARASQNAVPGSSTVRGQSDGAPSPTLPPTARAVAAPTHPWESSSTHVNANG